MLKKLKAWFESNGFGSKEICNLDKTCCPAAKTKCIDFDKVKEWHVKESGSVCLASVDGLYIDDEKERIYFIEMKGWQNFMKHQPLDEDSIRKQALSFDLKSKFEESLHILTAICYKRETMLSLTKEQRNRFTAISKYFILLTDIDTLLCSDPKSYIGAALGILSETSSNINVIDNMNTCTDEALKQIEVSNYKYTRLNSVIKKTCSEIDEYVRRGN
jgi:hypothetical protein